VPAQRIARRQRHIHNTKPIDEYLTDEFAPAHVPIISHPTPQDTLTEKLLCLRAIQLR